MKKYIVPTIEAQLVTFTQVICHSNDGQGSGDSPGEPSGDSQGAPMRWIF